MSTLTKEARAERDRCVAIAKSFADIHRQKLTLDTTRPLKQRMSRRDYDYHVTMLDAAEWMVSAIKSGGEVRPANNQESET